MMATDAHAPAETLTSNRAHTMMLPMRMLPLRPSRQAVLAVRVELWTHMLWQPIPREGRTLVQPMVYCRSLHRRCKFANTLGSESCNNTSPVLFSATVRFVSDGVLFKPEHARRSVDGSPENFLRGPKQRARQRKRPDLLLSGLNLLDTKRKTHTPLPINCTESHLPLCAPHIGLYRPV
jgi:hypothetical protein